MPVAEPGSRLAAAFATAEISGVRFHAATQTECVRYIARCCKEGRGGHVVTPNTDILRQCERDGSLRELVASCDLVTADGMPIVWASRLQRSPLPERVSGSNLISALAAEAAASGLSVFLLGGAPGTAERAAQILKDANPALMVAGTWFPEYGFERDPAQIEAMRRALLEANPDIIYVALSFPKGERLIRELRDALPRSWWIGVGISFSFLAGEVKRAPEWMHRSGIEWVHRLLQEPRRLGPRYLQDVPFALRMLAGAALRRGGRAG